MAAADRGSVVLVSAVRTPFGKLGGALAPLSTVDLGAAVIREVLSRVGVEPSVAQSVYMGVGMVGGATLVPTRQAMLKAGLVQETPSLTVDRACCSGITAAGMGLREILLGEADAVVCGGMESLSRTPYLLPRGGGFRPGHVVAEDPLLLRSPISDKAIAAYTGEEALRHGVSRADQDNWALGSHQKYFAAEAAGFFADERMQLAVPQAKGDPLLVTTDEPPRRDANLEKLASLKPVYGSPTITAGNAPGLNDGAAALLLMSAERARSLGLRPLATVLGHAQVSEGPTAGAYTPALAIRKVLQRTRHRVGQLARIEINEAFAATPLVSTKVLADGDAGAWQKLLRLTNVNGGAVALGHPLGASGARLIMTLVYDLRRKGGGLGAAAICGGYGQGDALLVRVEG